MIKSNNKDIKYIKTYNNQNIVKVIRNGLIIWQIVGDEQETRKGILFTGDPGALYRNSYFNFITDDLGEYFYEISELPINSKSYFQELEVKGIKFINVDTSNVTNMGNLFCDCHSLKDLDISCFNTVNVTDMSGMFGRCYELTLLDLRHFNTNNLNTIFSMFYGCSKLVSINLSTWETPKITVISTAFENCDILERIDISKLNISNLTGYQYRMFSSSPEINYIRCTLQFKDWCLSNSYGASLNSNMLNKGTWDIV